MSDRFVVRRSYRKANGDWCGVAGDLSIAEENGIRVWYFAHDTWMDRPLDEIPDDAFDEDIAPSPRRDDVVQACAVLNALHARYYDRT